MTRNQLLYSLSAIQAKLRKQEKEQEKDLLASLAYLKAKEVLRNE